MRAIGRKAVALAMSCVMVIGMTGCGKKTKKEPKPEPKATTVVDDGNTDAKGKGDGQSDTPLIVGCNKLSRNFNPFSVKTDDDILAVRLTQAQLVVNDRLGQVIYNGIDGEVKEYDGKDYTYYGTSDIGVRYRQKTDRTTYTITIRDDIMFSDGEPVTIDDVIFTLYAFCDNDYKGDEKIGFSDIVGLTNYKANNNKAEKISDKKVKKYIRKNPAKLKRWIKKNIKSGRLNKNVKKTYDRAVEQEARRQLVSGKKGKKVKLISGIKRINDHQMTITTYGHNNDLLYDLRFPICPLHYYGDVSKYDYSKGRFGFKRGDISTISANKTTPVGAGPYRFVKYEKGVVYYTSNELYYNGCPKTAFVQLKEMGQLIKDARKNLTVTTPAPDTKETAEPTVDTKSTPSDKVAPTVEPTEIPKDAVNQIPEVTEIAEGTVDIMNMALNAEDLRWVAFANSNDKLSGDTISTGFVSNQTYEYVGINAGKVKVMGRVDSGQSKYLRKALATVISAYKDKASEYYGDAVSFIDYPYSSQSWLYPDKSDDEYSSAFTTDINGEEIYDDDTDEEKKTEAVKKAALEYLEKAGYKVENDKVTEAANGGLLKYNIVILDGESNPMYSVIEAAAKTLDEIGITLNIVSADDKAEFNKKIRLGSLQMWCGTCDIEAGYDMSGRYGVSDNIFGVHDSLLNKFAIKADVTVKDYRKKKLYKKSFDIIRDWAVEIPMYEVKETTLFTAKRINMKKMTKDTTQYYDWVNEIQKVTMK